MEVFLCDGMLTGCRNGKVSGITAEWYQTIVAIVDDEVRDIRVTQEGFNELKGIVNKLAQAQASLRALLRLE